MLPPFFVWQDKALIRIHPEEVMYLKTEGNYTRILLTNKGYCLVRSTLSRILKQLPRDMFIKTHRSYAVSMYYIDHLVRDHLTIEDEAVPIGKRYYDRVISRLSIIE